jgi:hypothetical protein
MSNNNCDMVYNINQILPNVLNAINNKEFANIKMDKGAIADILNKNVGEGVILIFSKDGLIDITYKNNVNGFLDKFKAIANDEVVFMVIHSIENVKNQEIACNMIANYLKLILDNCDE